jgi:hypothetical protein
MGVVRRRLISSSGRTTASPWWGVRQQYNGDDTVGLVLGFSRTATDFHHGVTRLTDILRHQAH